MTQDHEMQKLLKDVRHSSGEMIDCNGETDNDVPPVTKMQEYPYHRPKQAHRRL